MKKLLLSLCVMISASLCAADAFRVVLLDCEDETGLKPDALLGGTIAPGAVAAKGIYLLGRQLSQNSSFVLIDRRDFTSQMERLRLRDKGATAQVQPSFIHAAQALNADAVLRSSLLTFSSGKRIVDQGGYRTELVKLSVRVILEALDAVDGTIMGIAEGVSQSTFRQTENVKTVLSEDDVLQTVGNAFAHAIPDLEKALKSRWSEMASRPTVGLSVTTTDDPAFVEIDGILIGSTPVTDHRVYKGDHIVTVGKPGYQDITKRIMFEKDLAIEVPMLRTDLTADELKEVIGKMRFHAVTVVEPGLTIRTID